MKNSVVMIVDDEPSIREALVRLLRLHGHLTMEAADGQAALTLLREGKMPCIIVTDLMMPGMDGWQFIREVKKDPSLAPTPILLCSASGDARAAATALEVLGLDKPIQVEDLLLVLQKYC